MTVTDGATRPRRADARRNYDSLLAAAVAAFAEQGTDVSLEDIAKSAGVGIGTLYRNFPSRESLVVAAYREGVELLCARAAELLIEHSDDPVEALSQWMRRFVDYVATKRGLAAILKSAAENHDELFAYVRGRINDAMDSLLQAAVAAGQIRADVTPQDLLRAMGGICLVSDQDGWQEQARRLLSLLMDGLRYGAVAAPVPAR